MDSQEKIEYIKSYLKKHEYVYIEITDEKSVNEIYDLYANNVVRDSSDGMVLNYYGIFYKIIEDYLFMEKYYLMAIDKGNSAAMCNLGNYYKTIKDYPNMMKYYLMAIDKGNSAAINNLSLYYYDIKDYTSMEKYYLMSIELGNLISMNNLGCYYYDIKDYSNMLKYYLMAIDKGNCGSMYNLGYHHEEIKNYSSMEKYYLMAIKHGCQRSEKRLAEYYKNNKMYEQLVYMYFDLNESNKMKLIQSLDLYISQISKDISKRIIEIISELDLTDIECSIGVRLVYNILKQKIDIIDLHYNYSPGEKGCKEAKDDFISRCITK